MKKDTSTKRTKAAKGENVKNAVTKTNDTKKNDKKTAEVTEIVFILDRSGSMGGLENDTIGGYNSMLKKQKKEAGEAIVSTILFDDKIEVLHDRLPIKKIDPITDDEYFVRGSTALLDAVGGAINHINGVHKKLEKDERPDKTLFIITTDGMENASSEYTYDKVKKLVEKQKEKDHWEFIFLGANIDAVEVAGRFGVARNRAVRYECDSAGTALNFEVMSNMVSCARKCKDAGTMQEAFDCDELLAPIQADYRMRHK